MNGALCCNVPGILRSRLFEGLHIGATRRGLVSVACAQAAVENDEATAASRVPVQWSRHDWSFIKGPGGFQLHCY